MKFFVPRVYKKSLWIRGRKNKGNGIWHSLGNFEFEKGLITIQVSNEDTEGYVIVDSAQILPLLP